MHKRSWWRAVAAAVLGLCAGLMVSGCGTIKASVPVAVRTPVYCGSVKLYGTDNVPFEYEELGVVALYAHESSSLEEKVTQFVNEAQKMGADAILNFRVEPVNDIVLVIFGFGGGAGPCHGGYRITGVAVEIKRP